MKKSVLTALVIVILVGAYFVFSAWSFLRASPSASAQQVLFEVAPGKSFAAVAESLEEKGLITDARKFSLLARARKAAGKVRVGEYSISKNLPPGKVLELITSGKSLERAITIQEGLNLFEIGEQLERQGLAARGEFLQLARDKAFIKEVLGEPQTSLEGYLFPETYNVTKYTGAKGLARMMVARFLEVYRSIPPHRFTRHQLVTLASIVEKETGAPEERAIISSVFHNRLRQGMRLQTDPTVIYGLFLNTGTWDRNISRADLLRDNRYNTYTRSGLPPGPISNPGRDALIAAVQPASTKFLFFVSRNDGTHVFTESYPEHERAVAQFQLDRRAREGKSWRDLKKRKTPPPPAAATKSR